MLDTILQGFYEKLKPIAEKNRRYLKYGKTAIILLVIAYATVSLIVSLGARIFWNFDPNVLVAGTGVVWIILFLLTVRFLNGKYRKYSLTVDEWSIFLACSILKNLEDYSEASKRQNEELKKEYKKLAVQDAKDFLSTVESGWKIGDFKLAKKVFNEAISKFEKNLQTRLIPNLERLDDGVLDKMESIVFNIAFVANNGDLALLNLLNDSSFKQLTEHPLSKVKFLSRCSDYLQVNRMLRHVLVFVIIGVVSISAFVIGGYLGASIDTTYATTFLVFCTLVAAYIAIAFIKRESIKTVESK